MSEKVMNIRLSRYPDFRALNDKGIREAISDNHIVISPEITDDQIQPGSLDVRIGEVYLYDDEVRREYNNLLKKARNSTEIKEIGELTRKYAKYFPNIKDQPITITPGNFAEICLHEDILFDKKEFFITNELRSGRGKIALRPYKMFLDYEDNKLSIGIWCVNKNPVIIYGQDKFANLFFNLRGNSKYSHGAAIHDADKVAELFPEFEKLGLITNEGYLVFKLGKELLTFKDNTIIDTRNPGELYYKHDLSKGYSLKINEPSIAQLFPEVNLPGNVGLLLLHRIPFHQQTINDYSFQTTDCHQVNAGWIDQGYKGNITAHPFRDMNSEILFEGKIFCFGQVYLYDSYSQRFYGDKSLGSHYQNSSGVTGSKS
ncbi:MAG: hypothetical protein ACP5NV_04345 [Candidatus Woesearchaeota archaeon]